MSKKSSRQTSFRERRAQFSNRILANGRMEVTPKEAYELEIQQVSLKEILERLYHQRGCLRSKRLSFREGSEEWNRISETLNRIQGEMGQIQKTLSEAKEKHFSVMFEFCAGLFLTTEANQHIRAMAWELMGKPPRATNADSPQTKRQLAAGVSV